MKNYDYIVIGAGSASSIALDAANQGMKVALIEELIPGGTCLNRGCIPTKVMLQSADIAENVRNSSVYGINAEFKDADLSVIKKRVDDIVLFWRNRLIKTINKNPNLDFYNCKTKFVGEKILEVKGEKIRGNKIVIAVGMRPFIPPVKGIDKIDYLTNRNIFDLDKIPDSIAIIGGGYIGMEFAHFFQALGSKVIIIEMKEKLLNELNIDLCEKFNSMIENKYTVYTNTKLSEVKNNGSNKELICIKNNETINLKVDEVLVASGRTSNADTLDCNKTGVKLDDNNFVITDEFMQTNHPEIYAMGDCIGTPAFRHISGYQARILRKNLFKNKRIKPDYSIIPFAVFTSPEIASAGLSYQEAQTKFKNVITKKLTYFGNAKGKAIGVKGFTKAVINKDDNTILGFHIIGPYASILIHEVLPIMTAGLSYDKIAETIHIHPALSELIIWTFTEGK